MFHTEKIILQKNPNTIKIHFRDINLSKAGESKTKINQPQNLVKNKNTNHNSYKALIKKIAFQLKKRTKLPECKIFKFYLSYRLLILRIAKRLKATAKRFNFWEKNETEMTLKDVDQIQEIASTAIKIIQNKGKKIQKRKNIASSGRQKNKSPKVKLNLLKKTEEEKIKKINIITEDNKEEVSYKNILDKLNSIVIDKKDINAFIKKFGTFLNDNNIEIMRENKLPNFINKKNEFLLTQKSFWIKFIIYVSERYKNELNLFNFINFVEQFFLWCNTPGDNMDFIVELKLQIYKIFDEQKINNFLLVNRLNNIDQLFERYKKLNLPKEKLIEKKIDLDKCTCKTCTEKGYYQKVIEFNKNHNQILFSKNNNLSFIPMDIEHIKFDKDKTLYIQGENNIEYSILGENKYYDNNVFNFLNKLEKGKAESERKKKKNTSTKKKTKENKEQTIQSIIIEDDEKEKGDKNKSKKKGRKTNNDKISAILDLMGIENDLESEDTDTNNKVKKV